MLERILIGFLSYFLILTYLHPQLQNRALAWGLLVGPAVLMLASLTAAIICERRTASSPVRYDWQWLLIAFALAAPSAALLNRSPDDAAAVSLMALLIVAVTAVGASIPRFITIAFALCILGSGISYHLGANQFGYLPWHEAANPTFAGVSRVSLFPYISDSALFSTLVLIAAVMLRRQYLWLTLPAGYFVFLSHSRTALIIIGAVVLSEFLSWARLRGSINFLAVVAVIILSVGFADRVVPSIISVEQSVLGKSVLESWLTRRSVVPIDSAGNVIPAELWEQHGESRDPHLSGRAALWRDHLAAFTSSPLTGVGRQGAIEAIQRTSIDSSASGSESFFTRILAEFGIIALLFWGALWRLFIHFDRARNSFGRAMTIALVVVGAVYGSSMVPYSFVLLCHIALIGYALHLPRAASVPPPQQLLSMYRTS